MAIVLFKGVDVMVNTNTTPCLIKGNLIPNVIDDSLWDEIVKNNSFIQMWIDQDNILVNSKNTDNVKEDKYQQEVKESKTRHDKAKKEAEKTVSEVLK